MTQQGQGTALETISALAKQHYEQEIGSARQLETWAQSIQVVDQPTLDWAGDMVQRIAAEHDRLDALRKSLTGPLEDVKRGINGLFNATLKHYSGAEQVFKGKILAYTQAVAASRREEAQAGLPVSEPLAETPGVSIRKRREAVIVDADKVPRQFCSPDLDKIKAHLEAGGTEAIAGVEFRDVQTVAVSRKGKTK